MSAADKRAALDKVAALITRALERASQSTPSSGGKS